MLIGATPECVTGDLNISDKMIFLNNLGIDFLELTLSREKITELNSNSFIEYLNVIKSINLPILSTSMSHFTNFATKVAREQAEIIEHIRSLIGFTKDIGADTILLATREDQKDVTELADVYRQWLIPVAEQAAKVNVTLALEHVGRYKPATLAELVQVIDHPSIRMYFDIGNCLFAGESPVEQARLCAPLITQIHIKGGPVAPLAAMPLAEVRHIIENAGFRGRACLEIVGGPGNYHLLEARGLLKMAGYSTF